MWQIKAEKLYNIDDIIQVRCSNLNLIIFGTPFCCCGFFQIHVNSNLHPHRDTYISLIHVLLNLKCWIANLHTVSIECLTRSIELYLFKNPFKHCHAIKCSKSQLTIHWEKIEIFYQIFFNLLQFLRKNLAIHLKKACVKTCEPYCMRDSLSTAEKCFLFTKHYMPISSTWFWCLFCIK